ncbi:MAG: hypothetical protein ACXVA9_14040 [Bdellovibrionales bacterium]
MRKLTHVLLVLAALSLAACGSLEKKANKQFEDGQFAAAAGLYEKVLAKDPGNGQAQERLQQSRQHILEDRLIAVRQLRMSENFSEALTRLDETIAQEAAWKLSPTGAAYSTQTEEVEMLFRWFNTQILNDLKDGKYLRAKIFEDKYKGIFQSGELRRKEMYLATQISSHGAQHCEQLKSTAQGNYAREFVNRYCIYWGKAESDTKRAAFKPARGFETGYSKIDLAGKIEGIPELALTNLSSELLDGLKKTPFFDPSGGALKVNIQGSFVSEYKEHPTIAMHSYQVQVPYQVMVTVPYSDSEPFTNYRSKIDPATGHTTQEAFTDYRSVTKYRQDVETRYRSEERSLPYPTTDYTLHFLLAAKVQLNLDHVPHTLPLDEQLDLNGSYHDINNPAIGLRPKPKQVPTEVDWLRQHFMLASEVLVSQITNAWDTKYCNVPVNLQSTTQIEGVMKCLKGSNRTHDFVENWFKAKFGLPYKVVGQTIGFGV